MKYGAVRKFSQLLLSAICSMYPAKIIIPEAERSEVTNRVVFGLITWFAGPGKSSRGFIYIYICIYIYMNIFKSAYICICICIYLSLRNYTHFLVP